MIASDLDGTLLRTDGTISERTRAALQRAQGAGISVVFVSGRHPLTLRTVAVEAGISEPAVCSNGAIIYDPHQDTMLHHMMLEQSVARRIVLGLRELLPDIAFAVERGRDFSWEPAFALRRGAAGAHIPVCEDVLHFCAEPITKLIAWHEETNSETLIEYTRGIANEDEVTLTYSTPHHIEISLAGVHKAAGLEWISAARGIRPEQVMAFGDMPNDIAMLRWAGHGVAVANAHPQVLEVADEVTASNTEDGVAQVVERLLEGAYEAA
ncbi:MAG TPA: Cof-type HAD-IIB family hydrolase [Ktedonobacterales bacterium]